MTSQIDTEFSEETNPEKLDNGVDKAIEVNEEYRHYGEHVERETTINILEDGGVNLSQSVQGCHDSLTLNGDVIDRIITEAVQR